MGKDRTTPAPKKAAEPVDKKAAAKAKAPRSTPAKPAAGAAPAEEKKAANKKQRR